MNLDFLPTLYLLRLAQSLPSFVLHLPEGRVIDKPSFEIRSPKYISCQFCALYLHIYFWSIIKCQMYCKEYLETKTSEKLLCLTKVQYSIFVVVKQLRKHTFFSIFLSHLQYIQCSQLSREKPFLNHLPFYCNCPLKNLKKALQVVKLILVYPQVVLELS